MPAEPSRNSDDDVTLVDRIRNGSDRRDVEDACRALVERHWRLLNVVVRGRVRSARDAEDIAQAAFVRAFRALENLDEPRRFLGWLLRIAQNLTTDHLRRRRSDTSIDALGEESLATSHRRTPDSFGAESISERVERDEEFERVLEALPKIPEAYRRVLVLRYLRGLSNVEIAQRLGEPEGTIRNRLFRALQKMRDLLSTPARRDERSPRPQRRPDRSSRSTEENSTRSPQEGAQKATSET